MLYRLFTKTLIFATLLIVLTTKSFSQNSNFSQNVANKLIKIATSANKITKNDYNDFWNSTGVKSREEKINLISILKGNFVLIQEYNNILWECAEKSWTESRIFDCQKINKNFLNIKKDLYKLIGQEEFKKIDLNFNNVINASAKREGSIDFETSKESISLEKIRTAKQMSQVMLQRIDVIMQPEFK